MKRPVCFVPTREEFEITVREPEWVGQWVAFDDDKVDCDWDGERYVRLYPQGEGSTAEDAIEDLFDLMDERAAVRS